MVTLVSSGKFLEPILQTLIYGWNEYPYAKQKIAIFIHFCTEQYSVNLFGIFMQLQYKQLSYLLLFGSVVVEFLEFRHGTLQFSVYAFCGNKTAETPATKSSFRSFAEIEALFTACLLMILVAALITYCFFVVVVFLLLTCRLCFQLLSTETSGFCSVFASFSYLCKACIYSLNILYSNLNIGRVFLSQAHTHMRT